MHKYGDAILFLDFIFFFILNSFQFTDSQILLHPEQAGFRGRFINYRPSDPGADLATTCLYFDRKGFLWMGTSWELYRFDGLEYKPFYTNRSDPSGLAGNYVTDIYEDKSGRLWISTLGALNCLNQKTLTFSHYIPDTTNYLKSCNMIYYIFEDSRELIWLVTGADIYTFNKLSETFRRYRIDSLSYFYQGFPLNRPGRILEDDQGRIWIRSRYGLYMYDLSVDSLVVFRKIEGDSCSLSDNYITNIRKDPRGVLWCSTWGGLHKISDPAKGIFTRIDLVTENKYRTRFDSIITLLPDSKGNIWAFGNSTVSCYNPVSGKTENYIISRPDYFLVGGRIICEGNYLFAFEDNAEIWFLNTLCGLMYRMNPLTGKTVLYQLPYYAVLNCIMDKNSSFWFGCVITNTWRLINEDLQYGTVNLRENSPSVMMEKADLIAESERQIILTLSSGVYTTENISLNAEYKLKPFYFPDGTSNATCVYLDPSGDLWFGREQGKISRYKKSPSVFNNFSLPSDQTGQVKKFHKDAHGDLWMRTYYGIYKMSAGKNEIKQFFSGDRDLDLTISRGITDICFGSDGKMWIAPYYGNGIFMYDINNKEVRFYGSGAGLDLTAQDYCIKISEDSEGRIWVLFSSNGLFLYDLKEDRFNKILLKTDQGGRLDFLDFYADGNERLTLSHRGGFIFYDMKTEEYKTIRFQQPSQFNHFYHPIKGNLLYINGNRLMVFPDTIPVNNSPPSVYLTSLQINNQDYNSQHPESEEIASLKKISLSYSQNNLRFSFTALNFLDADLCKYRYFMNGIDNDTITVSSGFRYAEYKKMKPGNYSFWVTGSNNDGIWNREGKTLEIRIFRPWYSSMLAIMLYFMLFICSVNLLIRIRLKHLKLEKATLEKTVAIRTAELEEKNRQIEEMDRIKTKFFTEISHEIRTPLSLIVGPIENLISETSGKVEERSLRWMEVIRRNGSRLTKLVNQLLDISRLDAGKMKLTLSESDIFKCIRVISSGFLSTD
jgi:ligand-binding sensor domain-containing protein